MAGLFCKSFACTPSGTLGRLGSMRIFPHHLYGGGPRSIGWCASGCRAWFAAHGLHWGRFLQEGIEEEALLATGCDLARQAVQHARSTAPESIPAPPESARD